MGSRVLVVSLVLLLSATMAKAEIVRLTTGNDYKPFTDESLPEGGLAVALVRAAYARVGRDVEIVWRPWKRGYLETREGLFVATFPYVKTPERQRDYRYSEPIFAHSRRVVVLADSLISADSLDDLKGMQMCRPVGYAIGPRLRRMVAAGDITLNRPNTMELCFQLLALGRVDFVTINHWQGAATIQEVFGSRTKTRVLEDISGFRQTLHVIFPRDQADAEQRVATFNKGLASIRADGTYDALVAKHLGAKAARADPATATP